MVPSRKLGVIAAIFVVAVSYNNCSKSQFNNVPGEDQASVVDPNGADQETPLPDEVMDPAPDKFHPVTDLDDPEIAKLYECDGGYSICHFPNSEGKENSLCVGFSAVKTHAGGAHQISIDENGNVLTWGDYLGPCKPR